MAMAIAFSALDYVLNAKSLGLLLIEALIRVSVNQKKVIQVVHVEAAVYNSTSFEYLFISGVPV